MDIFHYIQSPFTFLKLSTINTNTLFKNHPPPTSLLINKKSLKDKFSPELISQAFILKVWRLILTKHFTPLGPDFLFERTEP